MYQLYVNVLPLAVIGRRLVSAKRHIFQPVPYRSLLIKRMSNLAILLQHFCSKAVPCRYRLTSICNFTFLSLVALEAAGKCARRDFSAFLALSQRCEKNHECPRRKCFRLQVRVAYYGVMRSYCTVVHGGVIVDFSTMTRAQILTASINRSHDQNVAAEMLWAPFKKLLMIVPKY
jgi:hypothetical protein